MRVRPPGFMRAVFVVCLALVFAAIPVDPIVAFTATAASPKIETLPNGMRIVVVEDHAAPVVETTMWYRFGANDERPGKTGLAHALAHMMFSGTLALSQAGLDDVTARLGTRENATTANDYTAYTFVVPADRLEVMLRIEADRMQHLYLSDDLWKTEKAAILAEIDDARSTPLTRLYDRVCAAASAQRVCALSPLGDRADVARASAGDVRSYYQDWYAPENATLVIVGDVRPAEAFATARASFGAIPRNDPPPRNSAEPEFEIDRQVDVGGNFPYEVVDLAYPLPGSAEPDFAAYRIIDSVINNQRSLFYRGLVTSGYTLGYSTQLDQNVRGGLYHVFLVVAPGHTSAQARDAFTGILATAQSDGFPADLIGAAKTATLRAALYARDSVVTLGTRVGYAVAVENETDPAADDARIVATTAPDVARVARRYMRTPAVTGLLSPSAGNAGALPAPPATAVVDDFSRRAPAGRTVEAYWVRRGIAGTTALPSRVTPYAFTLNNGLRVLVDVVPSNPTVFVNGSVASSPAFDPPGKTGTGAMLSTLLASGAKNYDFEAQRKVADDLGATIDLGTAFDAHGRSEDLPALLDVIADSLMRPALAADQIDIVRRQTLEAVRARDADADARAEHDFDELLFGAGDPVLREPDPASLAAITASDLRTYARAYLRPDLTTISITGNVDRAAVRTSVERAFGGWQATGPAPNVALPRPASSHAARRDVVSGSRYVTAQLGELAPTRANRDFDTLDLINDLLGAGGTWDTRFTAALRVERKLAFAASSSLDADAYRGTWSFRVSANPKNVDAAVGVLRGEIERLRRDPVGPFELERTKNKAIAADDVAEEATATIASRVQRLGANRLPLDEDATRAARYGAIDGADILRAAQTYLHPDDLVQVYEGPQQ